MYIAVVGENSKRRKLHTWTHGRGVYYDVPRSSRVRVTAKNLIYKPTDGSVPLHYPCSSSGPLTPRPFATSLFSSSSLYGYSHLSRTSGHATHHAWCRHYTAKYLQCEIYHHWLIVYTYVLSHSHTLNEGRKWWLRRRIHCLGEKNK